MWTYNFLMNAFEFPLNGEYRMNLLMGKECYVSLLLLQSRTVTAAAFVDGLQLH